MNNDKKEENTFVLEETKPIEKPKNFKKTLKKFLSYLSVYKFQLFVVAFLAVLSTIFTIIGPKILGKATTEIFRGIHAQLLGKTGIDFLYIKKIILVLFILYLVSALFQMIQNIITSILVQKVTYTMRKEVSKKINKLPFASLEQKNKGEVLSLLTNDIDTISENLSEILTSIISSIISTIGILVMMLSISFSLTGITILILPVALFIILFLAFLSQKHFKKQQAMLSTISSQVEEISSGVFTIQAYNAKENIIKRFKKENKELYDSAWKSQTLSGLMQPITSFVSSLGYVLIAIIGAKLVIRGKIKVGDMQSFIQYSKEFTTPLSEVTETSSMIQAMLASFERVSLFLEEEEEKDKGMSLDLKKVKGDVSFCHVKFGYKKGKTILHDFTFQAKKGQKIAIVGKTGAGKTTLINLLLRFYDLNGGKILLDETDISKIKKTDLREAFGIVLQEPFLFNTSVLENIKYGKKNATLEEVKHAAHLVGADTFIETLPNGYDHILSEDSNNISSGQKQLLTIARTILKDPKILILDEATSNIDTRSEVHIQKAMQMLMKNKTCFIIAHRLSTIKNADCILVMDKGRILEVGSHKELLRKNGFYKKLYFASFDKQEK